jgi:hypothetical protein
LENSRIGIGNKLALQFLPSAAFGGAYKPGDTFLVSASQAMQKISNEEADLLRGYLRSKGDNLRRNEEFRRRFPHALQG